MRCPFPKRFKRIGDIVVQVLPLKGKCCFLLAFGIVLDKVLVVCLIRNNTTAGDGRSIVEWALLVGVQVKQERCEVDLVNLVVWVGCTTPREQEPPVAIGSGVAEGDETVAPIGNRFAGMNIGIGDVVVGGLQIIVF